MRRFILLCLVILLSWVGGLCWFVEQMQVSRMPSHAVKTEHEAMVVFTGGSQRISEGIALFLERRAEKLLISGVGKGITLDNILNASGVSLTDAQKARITLGELATTTRENAVETHAWLMFNQLDSAVLITANYHVPRALHELYTLDENKQFTIYPIFSKNVYMHGWWLSPGTLTLLISEYNKYLFALSRVYFLGK